MHTPNASRSWSFTRRIDGSLCAFRSSTRASRISIPQHAVVSQYTNSIASLLRITLYFNKNVRCFLLCVLTFGEQRAATLKLAYLPTKKSGVDTITYREVNSSVARR